jgi:uncharacterized protein YggU (UPF0235/DUF167 family)
VTKLALRIMPGAKASGWAGRMPDGRCRVKVKAPATEGKANDALVAFVALNLELPRRAVRIAHGAGGRDKVVEVDLEPEELSRRLAACGAGKEKE